MAKSNGFNCALLQRKRVRDCPAGERYRWRIGCAAAGSGLSRACLPWRWAQGRRQPRRIERGPALAMGIGTQEDQPQGPGDGLKVGGNLLDRAPVGSWRAGCRSRTRAAVGPGDGHRHPGGPASRPWRWAQGGRQPPGSGAGRPRIQYTLTGARSLHRHYLSGAIIACLGRQMFA